MARARVNTSNSVRGLFVGSSEVVVPRLILIVSVLLLTLIGLVMVFSSSTVEAIHEGSNPASYLIKQAGIAGASIVICAFIAWFVPYYKWLDRWLDIAWAASLVLLLLVFAMGTVGLGAKRWLSIGPVSFQPSELVKVALIIMMARIMYQYRIDEADFHQTVVHSIGYVFVPLGFLYLTQSDLGTTSIILVGILAVMWLGEVPWRPFVLALLLVIVFGLAAVFLVGYRQDRMSFLNPYADPYGDGYQLIRSFYAFGQGGLFGVGLGNSREKYLYLPEAETDFIFAIIGEEAGLIGVIVVVALFVAVLYSGLKIARNAPDLFGCMIAGGCTIMLVFQAFLNIGCVIGILPTTGKPLPFISSGGTSLLGSFLLIAMVLSVSFSSGAESGIYQRRREDLRVVRAQRAPSAQHPARSRNATGTGVPRSRNSANSAVRATQHTSQSGQLGTVSRRDRRL